MIKYLCLFTYCTQYVTKFVLSAHYTVELNDSNNKVTKKVDNHDC